MTTICCRYILVDLVQKLSKLVKICQSYRYELTATFFYEPPRMTISTLDYISSVDTN